MKYIKFTLILFLIGGLFVSCELEDEVQDGLPQFDTGDIDPQVLLDGAYGGLRDLQPQDNLMALTLHTSNELAGPTRGRDWDDAGIWRVLHTHSWTTAHSYVNGVWKTLNRNSFAAQDVLCAGASGQVAAEAQFLRTLNDFMVFDLWGNIPRRACGETLLNPPSILLRRAEIFNVIVPELEAIYGQLPASGPASQATQMAGSALLAKLYLNHAVYAATDGDGGALPGPYTFEGSDMDKVIEHCDNIINSNNYSLTANFFDNFHPDNGQISDELIFVSENTVGSASGEVRSRWHMTMHYNQNPSGWNGFVALSDLYNLFEENDSRVSGDYDYIRDAGSGMNVGFQVGQQYDADGNPLEDRVGSPLAFTPEFNLTETGANLEVTGIRCAKYAPDFDVQGASVDNDFVIFRFADVWLMKAEAIFRKGDNATALDMINTLRTARGASTLGSLSEQDILDERSRELYWEGWKRNDQIRFNAFLGTWQEKSNPSDPMRLLFPIPAEAISTNADLIQNPGY